MQHVSLGLFAAASELIFKVRHSFQLFWLPCAFRAMGTGGQEILPEAVANFAPVLFRDLRRRELTEYWKQNKKECSKKPLGLPTE